MLYGYETWSLKLWAEYRLQDLENKVPRNIFGPKREEITRGGEKLNHAVLRDF